MRYLMAPHVIAVDNVNRALPEALWHLKVAGVESPSRNGPVIVSPGPLLTVYRCPQQRVLFSPARDANPFFHFFEALWMLAGRNDVAYPARFAPRMKEFSDDNLTLNGAYGYRWRVRWFDQLKTIIEHLKENPASRREVLTMWTAGDLIDSSSKDLPCNTQVYVDIREGALNITVCNRSNDIWWGAYGANVVHMSFLQEFLARAIGVEIGVYIQFSNNAHIYTELYDGRKAVNEPNAFEDWTIYPETFPIMSLPYERWLKEVETFVDKGILIDYYDPFFNEVATPMLTSWYKYEKGELDLAIAYTEDIQAKDWSMACRDWLKRRMEKKRAKDN
jgi:thymidylate synthase